jgi:hypothetical protein
LNLTTSLEPAIEPANKITFLLDWELTMKCNLDCSYCETGTYGGHDNSTRHPPLDQCLESIDFMFAYVDLYISRRISSLRTVILNVYGGEALHHPDIVEILQACRNKYQQYKSKWNLTITTTTNAVVNTRQLVCIIPLIDEFTVSYHTGVNDKQKQQVRENLLTIHKSSARCKCVVMMDPKYFNNAIDQIAWLKQHNIKYLAKQLDHRIGQTNFNYSIQQVHWFNNVYQSRSYGVQSTTPKPTDNIPKDAENIDLADHGRACCGGRTLCIDQNYKSRTAFVDNKFPDWYCSVNHFFLFVKQVNGEIYTNKDCKMNFNGEIAPIGHLAQSQLLLEQTRSWLETDSMPVIQCKKYRCLCGLCAPKARDMDTYKSIMRKYEIPNSNLLQKTLGSN